MAMVSVEVWGGQPGWINGNQAAVIMGEYQSTGTACNDAYDCCSRERGLWRVVDAAGVEVAMYRYCYHDVNGYYSPHVERIN